jgi:hypothetical protein
MVLGTKAGAGDQIRTGDIQLGKLTLYQLSYARSRGDSLGVSGEVDELLAVETINAGGGAEP